MSIKTVNGVVPNLIVSLTSYPPRIEKAHIAIESLLHQSIKPEKVILWLSYEEFPNREKDLPKQITDLKKYDNFHIEWYKNIKSYKKLIPALINYPDAVIVTADDDSIYGPKNLEILYKNHLKYKKDILSFKVYYMPVINGKLLPRDKWIPMVYFGTSFVVNKHGIIQLYYGNKPIYGLNFLQVGSSMVLYPPHSFDDEFFDEKTFSNILANDDDTWVWTMSMLRNINKRLIVDKRARYFVIPDSQKVSLHSINPFKQTDFNFNLVLKQYPKIQKTLLDSDNNFQDYIDNENSASIVEKLFD